MEFPNLFASSGHVGHFTEPDMDSIYYEDDPFGTKAAPHPGALKFNGINFPPYLRFQRTSNDIFTVFGAWYSLVHETAKRINYSLVGVAPIPGQTEEEFALEALRFRADIGMYPLVVQTDAMLRFVEMGMIKESRIVNTIEMDHVLSDVRYKTKSLASMVTAFDLTSLVLTVTALACIALLARYFKSKPKKYSFNDVIWHLTTAVVWAPQVTAKKAVWRFVGITWLLGVFLLQQLFSGEMFQAMTLTPDLDGNEKLKPVFLPLVLITFIRMTISRTEHF